MLAEALVQKTVNDLLAADSAARGHLASLSGKRIGVKVCGNLLRFDWQLRVLNDGLIDVLEQHAEAPHCQLNGPPPAFIQLLKSAGSQHIDAFGLHIEGDVGVAMRFAQVAQMLDIDIEGLLAKRLGDTPARGLSRLADRLRQGAQQFRQRSVRGVGEAIGEEWRVGVHRIELEDFSADVDQLRRRVEQLEKQLPVG
ncbi:SCP2 sterol-binding domain-containing protein [Gammaproteobacteria bacterium]|nr:SCP2 sterol-binding domain-containing protein [Gammaproteobacteria bacterium]